MTLIISTTTTTKLPRINYTPVITAFVLKTWLLGILLAFFGFHLQAEEIKQVYLFAGTEAFNFWLGISSLLFGALGAVSVITKWLCGKKLFVMAGVIFASIMATTVLLVDSFSINGVSYCVDALVLMWVFIQLSWNGAAAH